MDAGSHPVYRQNRVGVVLKPQLRFAVAKVFEDSNEELFCGSPEVAQLVREALEARGWNLARINKEYVLYSAGCAESGEVNQFPGGKVGKA